VIKIVAVAVGSGRKNQLQLQWQEKTVAGEEHKFNAKCKISN
jgi:hypothetical protein